jgi:hypothetical protein
VPRAYPLAWLGASQYLVNELTRLVTASARRKRGDCICSNDVVLREPLVDEIVLGAVCASMGGDVVDSAIGKAMEMLRAGEGDELARRATVEREIAAVQARLGRLLEAVISGGSTGGAERCSAHQRL